MSSVPDKEIPRGILSRRSSGRPPSSLQIQYSSGEWTPDFVLDDSSPEPLSNSALMSVTGPVESDDHPNIPINNSLPRDEHVSSQLRSLKQPLKSPCFVHSLLDKGASFQDWLYHTRVNTPIGVSRSLGNGLGDQIQLKQPPTLPMPQPAPAHDSPPSSLDEEEGDDLEGTGSLTRQLAETAVGVREMSKQLGIFTLQYQCLMFINRHILYRACSRESQYTERDDHHKGQR